MDPITSRWQAYETDKRNYVPAIHDPTSMSPACSGLRIRREYAARDTINSRSWDFFHATPPSRISTDELQKASRPVYMDMNPIPSRTNTVQYRLQPQYIPDPSRSDTTIEDLGVAPAAPLPQLPSAKFSMNPYTQRLDAEGSDARNMIRELRSAVVEDNRERRTDADRILTERQFYDRWLPPKTAMDIGSLQAYELLRPKQDDWRANMRSGGAGDSL